MGDQKEGLIEKEDKRREKIGKYTKVREEDCGIGAGYQGSPTAVEMTLIGLRVEMVKQIFDKWRFNHSDCELLGGGKIASRNLYIPWDEIVPIDDLYLEDKIV